MTGVARLLPVGIVAVGLGMTLSARQVAPSGPSVFTAAQATAGRAVYMARCAGCHRPDLQGRNEAAPLAGANFMTTWRTPHGRRPARSTSRARCRRAAPARSASKTTINVTAFILAANSAQPGATADALDRGAHRQRGHWYVGHCGDRRRSGWRRRGPGRGRTQAGGRPQGRCGRRGGDGRRRGRELRAGHRRDAAQPAAGRLADGTAQLPGVEPQPARRDHRDERQGSAAGVVVVDERGRRQPADAARAQRHHVSREHRATWCRRSTRATGDLIWENQVGPDPVGIGAMRNLAIYEDKVFVATTDARLVGARRADRHAWSGRRPSPIAPRASPTRSGPIVIKGQGGAGAGRLRSLPRGALHDQRLRRRHRQAGLEVPHHRAHRRAWRRHVGQRCRT